jgi:hypothetical protein
VDEPESDLLSGFGFHECGVPVECQLITPLLIAQLIHFKA